MKYVEQADLPCYPNDQPLSDSRHVIGIQKGNTFVPDFDGYTCWSGGCGIGRAATIEEARERLAAYNRMRLERFRQDAIDRVAWADKMLEQFGDGTDLPGKFPPLVINDGK